MTVHTVYETTNLVNGKIYVGIHTTSDPGDSYLGSGTRFTRALRKYGAENFKKEILYEFDSLDEAKAKEAEIVDLVFLKLPDVYNLMPGGGDGWEYVNRILKLRSFLGREHTEDSRRKMSEKIKELFSTPEWKAKFSAIQKEVQNRPEERRRNSERQRVAQNRPEVSEKKRAANHERFSSPEARKSHSEACSTEHSRECRRKAKLGTKWMWNPSTRMTTNVREEDFQRMLGDGWLFGMGPRRVNHGLSSTD